MDHDLVAEGPAFRLRPVRLADAQFILDLRLDPQLSRYLHPVSADVGVQRQWLDEYFQRPGDYYWIVERGDSSPEGTIGLYDVHQDEGSGEWGRWVLRRGSLAAAESALLVYDLAFARLGLREVRCRTLADNKRVVHFHEACGLRTVGPAPPITLGGVGHPVVEQRLSRQDWEVERPRLLKRAEAAAKLIQR